MTGRGESQSKLGDSPAAAPAAAVVSKGLVRGNQDRLMLIPGGAGTKGRVTAEAAGYVTSGATALKGEVALEEEADPALASLPFQPPTSAGPSTADRRAEAKMKGYVGEACPECANFTLVRNGTCLKCDTCGSTTGCS